MAMTSTLLKPRPRFPGNEPTTFLEYFVARLRGRDQGW